MILQEDIVTHANFPILKLTNLRPKVPVISDFSGLYTCLFYVRLFVLSDLILTSNQKLGQHHWLPIPIYTQCLTNSVLFSLIKQVEGL